MNILLLNWRDPKNPKAGGAEVVTFEYARGWAKAGHTVTWLSTSFPGCKKEESFDGISIVRRGSPLSAFLLFPLYYLMLRDHFDVVIDEIHGLGYLTPLYVRRPIIGFIHEVAGDIWDFMYPFPLSWIGKRLEKIFFLPYRNVQFITVSSSTKRDLITLGIKEQNIHVLLNGLSNNIRTSLPNKKSVPTFIFVSRLVKMKGIEEILRAFSYIYKENRKSELIIVGEGDSAYKDYLKEYASGLGVQNVLFKGYVAEKEKLSLMASSHILLHASVKEGWGLVVIEAASQGTPAVVYNTGGLRDSVLQNKTGIIINKNLPEILGKESVELFNNKKRYQLFQKNCLIWAKKLSWDKSISASLSLLESLVVKN